MSMRIGDNRKREISEEIPQRETLAGLGLQEAPGNILAIDEIHQVLESHLQVRTDEQRPMVFLTAHLLGTPRDDLILAMSSNGEISFNGILFKAYSARVLNAGTNPHFEIEAVGVPPPSVESKPKSQ